MLMDDFKSTMMSPFDTYKAYVLVKAHFKDVGYDYFASGGKSRSVTLDSFNKRSDKHFFEKISRTLHNPEYFFAANLAYDSDGWIGDMVLAEAQYAYESFKTFVAKTEDRVATELTILRQPTLNMSLYPTVIGGSPEIAGHTRGMRVSLETLALLATQIDFLDSWSGSSNPLDATLRRRAAKYGPFILDALGGNTRALVNGMKRVYESDGTRRRLSVSA